MKITAEDIESIVRYRTSRSSGAGGQAVNKLETKVEANCTVEEIGVLSDQQKYIIREKLNNRINGNDELSVVISESRSQHQNKERAFKKLVGLINDALKVKPPRKPTKPSPASKQKRLEEKSKLSEIKTRRRWKLD